MLLRAKLYYLTMTPKCVVQNKKSLGRILISRISDVWKHPVLIPEHLFRNISFNTFWENLSLMEIPLSYPIDTIFCSI